MFFHVGQAIQRWIQRYGFTIFYNEPNSKLKILVGLVISLGLLPPNDVMEGYGLIIGSHHYVDMLTRANELDIPVVIINLLMTYFTDNYVNVINLQQWNVFELQDRRTSNILEGYHHRLRERFKNRVTNFWGFMLFILKESYLQSAYLERTRGGEQVPGRRRKYQRNEEMIMQHRANLVADNNILNFLVHVRLCIHN